MLIEKQVFNFHEVGEKSFEEIKNECLVSFAVDLRIALTSTDEHIRKFWCDSHVCNDGVTREGSVANYKHFHDFFSTMIKYNSKNIVFEETVHNGIGKCWSVQQTCMDVYGLEYVPPTEFSSGYYEYRKNSPTLVCDTCCMESIGDKREDSEKRVKNFYTAFGEGEFPFITITVIRIGNKDHYFYTIHR